MSATGPVAADVLGNVLLAANGSLVWVQAVRAPARFAEKAKVNAAVAMVYVKGGRVKEGGKKATVYPALAVLVSHAGVVQVVENPVGKAKVIDLPTAM